MDATIFQECDKPRSGDALARQYWRGMIDSIQVRLALRTLRTDAGLTPEEFADEGGINKATVYRIEDMEDASYSPRVETIGALVGGRGLTLSEFFVRIEGLRPTDPSDQQSATPTTKADPDARTLSAAERSADAVVQRALIVGLAEEIAGAIDRLIESRTTNRPIKKGTAAARSRTGTGG